MAPNLIFGLANLLAVSGWFGLAVALFAPARWAGPARRWGGWLVPLLLSLVYGVSFWSGRDAPGGFSSMAGVLQLFQNPHMLLAGWVHYLAFDLFAGHWQVRQALQGRWSRARRLAVLPCLAATFWVGPMGLLLFLVLHGRKVWHAAQPTSNATALAAARSTP